MPGENCASSCRTRDHDSYGQCLRSKNLAVVDPDGRVHRSQWDADLEAYATAKKYGVQPASTNRAAVDAAMRASESTGEAFQA